MKFYMDIKTNWIMYYSYTLPKNFPVFWVHSETLNLEITVLAFHYWESISDHSNLEENDLILTYSSVVSVDGQMPPLLCTCSEENFSAV